jgi:hypothetical protein
MPGTQAGSPAANLPAGVPPAVARDESVAVGTPEWDALTERRAALIHKKNRDGLDAAEQAEFARLQRLSRAALAKAFPGPPSDLDERLARLERTADDSGGGPTQ